MESILSVTIPMVIAALLIVYMMQRTGKSVPALLEQVSGIAELVETALVFVQSAQQQLKDKSNTEKLNWVIERLEGMDEFAWVSDSVMRDIIEAAVLRMKGQLPQPQVLPMVPTPPPGARDVTERAG